VQYIRTVTLPCLLLELLPFFTLNFFWDYKRYQQETTSLCSIPFRGSSSCLTGSCFSLVGYLNAWICYIFEKIFHLNILKYFTQISVFENWLRTPGIILGSDFSHINRQHLKEFVEWAIISHGNLTPNISHFKI
jgi:hypothetical protein